MFFYFSPNTLEKKEIDSINKINNLLKSFERELELISSEDMNFLIMARGRTICESMTEALSQKEGYGSPRERTTFLQNCNTLYQHNIIPKECYDFLNLIRRYGNEAIHGIEPSNRLVLSFLRAFDYLMQWFDNYFSLNYQTKFPIEKCRKLIGSLEYDKKNDALFLETEKMNRFEYDNAIQLEEMKTKQEINQLQTEIAQKELMIDALVKENEVLKKDISLNIEHIQEQDDEISSLKGEIKILNEKLDEKEEKHHAQIGELNKKIDETSKMIYENGKVFKRCLELTIETNDGIKRVETKVDDLHSKIDKISNQISTIQSFADRQIKKEQDPQRIEEIIETFIDECIDNIMKQSLHFQQNENYRVEKIKLVYSIGEEGWNKLCEKSKSFLITSKVMYNNLITMDDIVDYSGICVLVTKALEVELHKRFFTEFLEYLDDKYEQDYKRYHTALLYNYKKPLFSEKFSMGDIAFVMCYKDNWNDTNEQKANNELELMEYCRECIFSRYDESEIKALLNKYASSIEDIRKKYRNPSAHTNEIKRIDAEECFNLVLDIEKLLKQMLDSFDA